MKTISQLISVNLALSMLLTAGCKKKTDDTQDLLPVSYTGAMTLEYTKGLPAFSVTVEMAISISKDRKVTFGGGGSSNFDKTDIKYEDGKPVVKIRMTGTLALHEAKGEYKEISGEDYLWVWTHSSVNGQMTVWAWDDDAGWVQMVDTPFDYEDQYSDGNMQFSVAEATLTGAEIKKTLPDIEGTFTYGYLLLLVAIP